jgi:hypothetical protein
MSIRVPHLPWDFLVFLLCLKAAIVVVEQAQKPPVIFAAANLNDALEEVVALHAAAHEGPPVIISLANSGVLCGKSNLARQQTSSFLRNEYRPIIYTIGLWSQNPAYAA